MPGGLFPELFYNHPNMYIMLWILIYFLYAGAFSSIALSFGIFIKNKFVTLILPFIFYIMVGMLAELSDKLIYSPQCFLYLTTRQSFSIIVFEFIIIFIVTIALFCVGGYKHETY